MSEVLEGVFSETLLDEIASDLGIEAGVLRNSPFFRVIKGRVLLTYPLKVPTCDYVNPFTPYQFHANLSAGQVFNPAEGTIVMTALLAVVAKLQLYHDIVLLKDVPPATERGWIGSTYCDGTKVKYKNSDAGEQMLDLEGVSTL